MKLHMKLGLIFSLIALLSILANAAFYYSYEKRAYEDRADENLTALGEKMLRQLEDTVQVMDYTLENLIANTEFMDAMQQLMYLDRTAPFNQQRLLNARNMMGNVLYRDPLNKNFYRVNAFNRLGDFYSSRFDNRDTVNALTYDMAGIIFTIPFLDMLDKQPLKRMIIPPHKDPFTSTGNVTVFGAARAVIWMGKPIGYLEVQADVKDLAKVFSPEGLIELSVCARFSDGALLYENEPVAGGFELTLHSTKLKIALTLIQGMDAWRSDAFQFTWRTILVGLLTVLMAIVAINIISRRMTRSVRSLEHEISHMDLKGEGLTYVDGKLIPGTHHGDEIASLQLAFHALVERLGASIRDEMRARELHIKARLNALQAQINPHFIYNTLNMIGGKSLESGNIELAQLTERFAQMLRYSTNVNRRTATVLEEVHHASLYLELCKARFEDRLQYSIDVPEAMYAYVMPRLTLQPLVENSLVHGYINSVHEMAISITGAKRAGGFALTVRDNGDGFLQDTLSSLRKAVQVLKSGENVLDTQTEYPGVGMVNTFARLYLYSGGKMDISLLNDNGAVVEIVFFADARQRSEEHV